MSERATLVLKTLGFTLLFPGAVGGYFPWWLSPRRVPSDWRIGVPFAAAGLGIYLWCAWEFIARGRGTPAPWNAPRALVITGLYRWTRNPMYVGMLSIAIGWFVAFQTLALAEYALLLFCAFHLRVIWYEEPRLRREFGEAFDGYCHRVPRWV